MHAHTHTHTRAETLMVIMRNMVLSQDVKVLAKCGNTETLWEREDDLVVVLHSRYYLW